MRQPIVAGNWKMNGSRAMASELAEALLASARAEDRVELVLCPPHVLVPLVAEQLKGSRVKWGGQDLDVHDKGAYTGQVAGSMLADYGCSYCIVGHSERRTLYGETDQMVSQKFERALECGLAPILCVGETLRERENGDTESVLARQIDAVIERCGIGAFAGAVLAYEPVWAIGTGKTASPEMAQNAHAFVRSRLAALDQEVARNIRIQYGGSVKADNAADLFRQRDIDGGLIGGASLVAKDFLEIAAVAREET